MAGSARYASDLCAAHAQPVVVKLLPESDFLAAARIERQVDNRALGAHHAKSESQSTWLTATLEHHVGSAVPGAVTPAAFQLDGRVGFVGIDNLQPEVGRDPAACRGGLDEHYRCRTVQAGEQCGEQANDAGPGDSDSAAAHTVAETAYIGATDIGGGVQ